MLAATPGSTAIPQAQKWDTETILMSLWRPNSIAHSEQLHEAMIIEANLILPNIIGPATVKCFRMISLMHSHAPYNNRIHDTTAVSLLIPQLSVH